MIKIIFLGNFNNQTQLIGALWRYHSEVGLTEKILDPDKIEGIYLIISFGYFYIISNYFIDKIGLSNIKREVKICIY